MDKYMPSPVNAEKWLEMTKVFEEKLQFPHYFCVMDGKHMA